MHASVCVYAWMRGACGVFFVHERERVNACGRARVHVCIYALVIGHDHVRVRACACVWVRVREARALLCIGPQ